MPVPWVTRQPGGTEGGLTEGLPRRRVAEAGPPLRKWQHRDGPAPEVAHRRAEPRRPLRTAQEAAWGGARTGVQFIPVSPEVHGAEGGGRVTHFCGLVAPALAAAPWQPDAQLDHISPQAPSQGAAGSRRPPSHGHGGERENPVPRYLPGARMDGTCQLALFRATAVPRGLAYPVFTYFLSVSWNTEI